MPSKSANEKMVGIMLTIFRSTDFNSSLISRRRSTRSTRNRRLTTKNSGCSKKCENKLTTLTATIMKSNQFQNPCSSTKNLVLFFELRLKDQSLKKLKIFSSANSLRMISQAKKVVNNQSITSNTNLCSG